MPVTGVDDIARSLPGIRRRFGKASFSPQAAGAMFNLWNTGALPAADSPGGGVNGQLVLSSRNGALAVPNAPAGAQTYLARAYVQASQPGSLIILDRQWEDSGLSVTTVGAQAITQPALTRPDALGKDMEAWLTVVTGLGAMGSAPTISYTDQDGNAGNTGTLIWPAVGSGGREFQFSLAAGDTGIRSIQSYNNVASLVSGSIALTLKKRIAEIEINAANLSIVVDFLELGLPIIDDGAAIEFVWVAQNTSSTQVLGSLQFIQV